MKQNNLTVGPFLELSEENDIYNFIESYNYPIIVKTRKGSFDGRGNQVIKNKIELTCWLNDNKLNIHNYYVESFINFGK